MKTNQLRTISVTQGYPEHPHCLRCGQAMETKVPEGDDKQRLVCPHCGWIFYDNPRPTVTAIIEKDHRVMLIKRAKDPFKGDWDLVGGFVEPRESLEQALAREVREEIGLKVLSSQYYFSWIDVYQNEADGHISNNVCTHFLVEVEAKDPVCGDDAAQASWFPWDKLPSNLVGFQDVIAVIQKRKEELHK